MKLPKLPLLILLILLGITLTVYTYKLNNFKNNKNEAYADYETSVECNTGADNKKITINFSKCEPCQKTIAGAFGSTKFTMYPMFTTDNTDKKFTRYCRLNYGVASDNPQTTDNLSTFCAIPLNYSDNSFSKSDFGIDFKKLGTLCETNLPEENVE